MPLYNHQIPPGAADVVHYRLDVPPDAVRGSITVEVALRYRKFDMDLLHALRLRRDFDERAADHGDRDGPRRLPDRWQRGATGSGSSRTSLEWQRWNDYGIGLLRKGGKSSGQLRQAEEAFARVEQLGRPTARSTSRASTSRRAPCATRRSPRSSARRPSIPRHRPGASPGSAVWSTSRTAFSTRRSSASRAGRGGHAGDARARLRLQPGLQPAQRARPDALRAGQAGAR